MSTNYKIKYNQSNFIHDDEDNKDGITMAMAKVMMVMMKIEVMMIVMHFGNLQPGLVNGLPMQLVYDDDGVDHHHLHHHLHYHRGQTCFVQAFLFRRFFL